MPRHGASALLSAADSRTASLVRRFILAAAFLFGWRVLGELASSPLDGGQPAAALAQQLRWGTIILSGLMILFVCRKFQALAAILASALFWHFENALLAAGRERDHCYIMPVILLFCYGATGLLHRSTEAEEFSWEICCAVVGAVYTMAGLSKLHYSGLGWINSYYLRLLTAGEIPWSSGLLLRIRSVLAGSPAFAWAASAGTLIIELSGVLMVWPSSRPYYTAALLCLHAGIFLSTGIIWPDHILLIAALGFPLDRPSRAAA